MHPVRFIPEDGLAPVATVEDMIDRAGEFDSSLSGHANAIYPMTPPTGKCDILRPTPLPHCQHSKTDTIAQT
jgi:hypothetical protein